MGRGEEEGRGEGGFERGGGGKGVDRDGVDGESG